MLFVVESHVVRVKAKILSQFVRDISAHFIVPAVLEPDLYQSFLGSQ